MQVINKGQERYEAKKAEEAKREKARRARDLIRAEASKPTEIFIDRRTWGVFLASLQNGAIMRAYGNEVGGAYFTHTQIEAADRFLTVAIRDRKQLTQLLLEEYDKHPHNIPLSLPEDQQTIDILTDEAQKLGIDYETYLRSLFYSLLEQINEMHVKIEEEKARQEWENRVVKVDGVINADIRRKLEEKYGPPVCVDLFGISRQWYLDMLIKVAEEYFGKGATKG